MVERFAGFTVNTSKKYKSIDFQGDLTGSLVVQIRSLVNNEPIHKQYAFFQLFQQPFGAILRQPKKKPYIV